MEDVDAHGHEIARWQAGAVNPWLRRLRRARTFRDCPGVVQQHAVVLLRRLDAGPCALAQLATASATGVCL